MGTITSANGKTHALTRKLMHHVKRYSRAVAWRLASTVNRRNNYHYSIVYRPDSDYFFGGIADYRECFEKWILGNECNNSGDLSRFYCIYQNVSYILEQKVPGELVELGVFKGNSAAILTHLGRKHRRTTYLFDTFSGFDRRDLSGVDSHRQVQFGDTSLEAVQRLVGTEMVKFVAGFFPESTANIVLPETIAVAHIDCDLYEPMKAGLEIFYPRLAAGGLLILHDYSSGYWPGVTRAIDEFFADRPEKPILIPDKSGTAIVRKPHICGASRMIRSDSNDP
jgi:O-methyltransferase